MDGSIIGFIIWVIVGCVLIGDSGWNSHVASVDTRITRIMK